MFHPTDTAPAMLVWRDVRFKGTTATLCLLIYVFSANRSGAQAVSTVREAEFRSRWTNYQVDLRSETEPTASQAPSDMLRIGPVDLRSAVGVGWEYSNQKVQNTDATHTGTNSFFIAPAVTGLYEKEVGAWKISAQYSVAWTFYLDPKYVANNGDGNSSQIGSLNLERVGDRLTLRSAASASYGTGFDIDRGSQTTRLSVNEALSGEYQLTEFLRAGSSLSLGFDTYSGAENGLNDSGNHFAGGAFVDDFVTDKTALRMELSAGQESRNSTPATDRDYVQGVFRVNYGPTTKLSFTLSAGVGYLEDTSVTANGETGLRAVYSLSSSYTPTEKTSATLYLGVEGASAKPEVNLAVNWHPRDPFYLSLSVYQQSGISLLSVNTNQVSQGVLLSLREQFFERVNTTLSGGIEREEYEDQLQSSIGNREPFSFVAFSLAWQMSRVVSWNLQLRTSSRRDASSTNEDGLQTRASISLNLTF